MFPLSDVDKVKEEGVLGKRLFSSSGEMMPPQELRTCCGGGKEALRRQNKQDVAIHMSSKGGREVKGDPQTPLGQRFFFLYANILISFSPMELHIIK